MGLGGRLFSLNCGDRDLSLGVGGSLESLSLNTYTPVTPGGSVGGVGVGHPNQGVPAGVVAVRAGVVRAGVVRAGDDVEEDFNC